MSKITEDTRQAADRLTIFFMKEALACSTEAIAKQDPLAARSLLEGSEETIMKAIRRIAERQSEGPDSMEIAMAVATCIADVLDEVRGMLKAYEPFYALHDATNAA